MPRAECPWCCEPTPPGPLCAHCGRDLADASGAPLTPLALRYESIRDHQHRRFMQLLATGTPIAAAAGFVSPLVTGPLHVVISLPILIAVHAIVLNLWLLRGNGRMLSLRRRWFTRATRRMGFYPLAVLGYGNAIVPVAGAAVAALTWAALTAAVHAHALWTLSLERDQRPLTAAEILFFTILSLLFLVVGALVVAILAGAVTLWHYANG